MCNIHIVNISGIDLNLLLAFEALVDERMSAGRPKELGSANRPSVMRSHGCALGLEDPLFVRTAQGMVPTPRAERLAGPIPIGPGSASSNL